jgi:S-adenosyl methyltransferase
MTSPGMRWAKAASGHVLPKIDATKPNAARIYDYWLGGKDNFAADRVAAEQILTEMPGADSRLRGTPSR